MKENFTVIIDGKECEASQGETILEVALRNKINIPFLCYHKELKPKGTCKVCVVEIANTSELVPACTLKAIPGMVVITNSPKVLKARERAIKSILQEHPLDCLKCSKSGECELQEIVFHHVFGKIERKMKKVNKLVDSELIDIETSKCVLCERCVRMCAENVGNSVLEVKEGGFVFPRASNFLDSGCEFCGNCIEVCPSGSLVDKVFNGSGKTWIMKKTISICPHCGSGCEVEIHWDKSGIKRIVGKIGKNKWINKGYLCLRGRWGWDAIENRRITKPLYREGERVFEISQKQAVKKFEEIVNDNFVNLFVDGSLTNEELALISRILGKKAITEAIILKELVEEFGKLDEFSAVYKADVVVYIGDFLEEFNPVSAILLRLFAVQNHKKVLRLGSFPSKIDEIASCVVISEQDEWVNVLKHCCVGVFDSSYKTGNPNIDCFLKLLKGNSVCFILGGTSLYRSDRKEISRTLKTLSSLLSGKSYFVVIPPKVNTLGVLKYFEPVLPEEPKGNVNVLFSVEPYRDLYGSYIDFSKPTVVFTTHYTSAISQATLILPIECFFEKEGTVVTINGERKIQKVRSFEHELIDYFTGFLKVNLPEERENGQKEPKSSLNFDKKLTIVIEKGGWNFVDRFSKNVAKVSGELTCLSGAIQTPKRVKIETPSGSIEVQAKPARIGKRSVLLKTPAITPEVSALIPKPFVLSSIPCRIVEGA